MRLLLSGLIATLLLPSPGLADITTGLVGHWPFSGNAADVSGFGNHGTPSATVVGTADRFGNPASAYAFDGLTSRIDIPSSPSLESPTTALTMAAWVRRDGWGMVGSGYSPILTKSTELTNAFQYRFTTSASGIGTALNNWNTAVTAPFVPEDLAWYHLVSTWEADTLKVYANGALWFVAPLVATIVPDNRMLSIGSDTPGVLEIFRGTIDEVRIYNRALSAADVAELAGPVTSVPLPVSSIARLEIGRAFPNPARVAASIPFRISEPTAVDLDILDIRGRRVRQLLAGRVFAAGPHEVVWDARDTEGRSVAGGIYLVRLSGSGDSVAGKVLIRR